MNDILNRQRDYFRTGATLPFAKRKEALDALYAGILKYEKELLSALEADLGKSEAEAYMCEVGFALSEIRDARRHLRGWMRPRRRHTELANFPARSRIESEPYGVVLILAPWNYPFLLTVSPLIGALAAGNCCVLKPSELAPATAAVLTRLIADVFPEHYVTVVNGAVPESRQLLALDFDYVFYTGSPEVGKLVMEAAAKHLTPVTLELGGKSPAVITKRADLRLAARRIVFGKFLNAGQTCVAPDYVLCEEAVHDTFLRLLGEEIHRLYGARPLDNPDYGKIINRRHYDRICRLIDPDKVVIGGERQDDRLRIAPTVLDDVSPDDAVMGEEIFGPVLPILRVKDTQEAFRFIQDRPHPLALYLFTRDAAEEKRFMTGLQFGGGCVNDTLSQVSTHNLPFGGIGRSGMGAYHGRSSFRTFSHEKTVIKRCLWPDIPLRYPPYTEGKRRLVRSILHMLIPLVLVSCGGRELPALGPECRVVPLYGAEVDSCGARVTVTPADRFSGFELQGRWNLLNCARLRFTLCNNNPDDYLDLTLLLENERTDPDARPSVGILEDRVKVAPGETRTVEVLLPCDMAHPEVNRLLTLMKGTPYGEFRHRQYGVDLSDVRRIRFQSKKQYPGSSWSVERPVFLKGKRPAPDYMQLDSAAFFPMIDRFGQFKYKDWPGKTHTEADLQKARATEEKDLEAHPGPSGWNRFGGWADGPRFEATGRFRVQKVNGKWWMIDPEGCLFWSHGIIRVNASSAVTPLHGKNLPSRNYMFEYLPEPGDSLYAFRFTNDALLVPYYERWQEDSTFDFSSANIYRKYGPGYKETWADLAHRRLRSWGLNTIANSSDIDICRMDRTPFIDRFDIRSVPIEGADGPWFPIMDPFDPSFRKAVEDQLILHRRDIEDPYLLGYFVDNEIRWGDATHAARCVVAAPETQAAKKAMRSFLKERHGKAVEPSCASEEDLLLFNKAIIEAYYKVIRESFDRYAPGVLYMGCRFAGFTSSNEDAVLIGARYCDVISHNQYRYLIDSYRLPGGLDKPVIVGEWHLGAYDRGMMHPSLQECADQRERAWFYGEYMRGALEHPLIIGVHWHQFMDQATTGRFDGENFQVGFLDCCDTPYPETVAACRRAGYGLYQTRYGSR